MYLRIKKFFIDSVKDNNLHTNKEYVLEDYLNLNQNKTKTDFKKLDFSRNISSVDIGSTKYEQVNFDEFVIDKIPSFLIKNTTQSFMKELFVNTSSLKGALKQVLSFGNSQFKVLTSTLTGFAVGSTTGNSSDGITAGFVNLIGGGEALVDYLFAKNTLSKGQVIYEDFITGAKVYTKSETSSLNLSLKFDYANLKDNRERVVTYLQDLFFLHSLILPMKPSNKELKLDDNINVGTKTVNYTMSDNMYNVTITDFDNVDKLPIIDVIKQYGKNYNIFNFGNRNVYYNNTTPICEYISEKNTIPSEILKSNLEYTTTFKIMKLIEDKFKYNNVLTTKYSGINVENYEGILPDFISTEKLSFVGEQIYPYIEKEIITLQNNTLFVDYNKLTDIFFLASAQYYNVSENTFNSLTTDEKFWMVIKDIIDKNKGTQIVASENIVSYYTVYKELTGEIIYISNRKNEIQFVNKETTFVIKNVLSYVSSFDDNYSNKIYDLVETDLTNFVPANKYDLDDVPIAIFPKEYFNKNKVIKIGTYTGSNGLTQEDFDKNVFGIVDGDVFNWGIVDETIVNPIFNAICGVSYDKETYSSKIAYLPLQNNKSINKTIINFYKGDENVYKDVSESLTALDMVKKTISNIWTSFVDTILKTPPMLRMEVCDKDNNILMNYQDYVATALDINMGNKFYLYKHIDFLNKNKDKLKLSDEVINNYEKDNWNLLVPNFMSVNLTLEPIMSHPYEVIAKDFFHLDSIENQRTDKLFDGIAVINDLTEEVKSFASSIFNGDILINDSSDDSLVEGMSKALESAESKIREIYNPSENSNKKLKYFGKREAILGKKYFGYAFSNHYIERAIDLRFNNSDVPITAYTNSNDDFLASYTTGKVFELYFQVPISSITEVGLNSDFVTDTVTNVFYKSDYAKFNDSGLISGNEGATVQNKNFRYINLTKLFKSCGLTGIGYPTKGNNQPFKDEKEFLAYNESWHLNYLNGLNVGDKYLPLLKQNQGDDIYKPTANYFDAWNDLGEMEKVKFNGASFRYTGTNSTFISKYKK